MKLKGVVTWSDNSARIEDAVIVPALANTSEFASPVMTDSNGVFETDELSVGRWQLRAYHSGGRQPGPLEIELKESEDSSVSITLNSFDRTVNQPLGYVFFGALILLLIISVYTAYSFWKSAVSDGCLLYTSDAADE